MKRASSCATVITFWEKELKYPQMIKLNDSNSLINELCFRRIRKYCHTLILCYKIIHRIKGITKFVYTRFSGFKAVYLFQNVCILLFSMVHCFLIKIHSLKFFSNHFLSFGLNKCMVHLYYFCCSNTEGVLF